MTSQRHKYEYEPLPDSAPARVVRLVGEGKAVLELGPGPGAITRLLKDHGCRVTGLEVDPSAIEIVAQYCEQVYACDLNDPAWPATLPVGQKYEVLVAADVLEHLYDPWTTLGNMHGLVAGNGFVVISLPHAGHNAVIACLLGGSLDYQPWGLLDKTHIRFFAIKNIQRLFDDAGFKIVDVEFVVKKPQQTEFSRQWRSLSTETRRALDSNRFGNVYQVVVKAVPQASPGVALNLEAVPIPAPANTPIRTFAEESRVVKYLCSLAGPRTRRKAAALLARIGFKS